MARLLERLADAGKPVDGVIGYRIRRRDPFHRIDVLTPSTAKVPDSGPTVASRTVMVVGGLLSRAGEKLAETLRAFAAHAAN